MSALTSLFTSMANKIRSKVGGSDTYTPTEMVSAIDDVYDAGIADATTDITPSDASPVAMLANLGYKPTTNGYAIESNPTSLTPSNSSPATISSGTIYKASAGGKAVESVIDKTPSNSSPASLSSGSIVKVGANGYAIESYKTVNPQTAIIDNIDTSKVYKFSQTGIIIDNFDKNIIPSNVNPASFSLADKCFMTDSGYAISSYDSVTPSSSPASVSSGDIVKIGGSGKIVDAISDVTPSDSSPVSLTSGLTYKMGGGGYAIENEPTSLTPNNYSSPTITSGTIYKAANDGVAVSSVIEVTSSDNFPYPVGRGKIVRNMIGVGSAVTGYIIESYTEKVPNDTTPPSVAVGDIVKIKTNGGYLYKTQQSFSKSIANLGGATLSGSSTKIRDIASYTASEKKTITLISFNASTNCSNDDAYVELYVNGTVKYATSHIPTGSSIINNIVDFVSVNIELNANDVVVLKTNWSNSHTNVNWKFYNIQLGFVQ